MTILRPPHYPTYTCDHRTVIGGYITQVFIRDTTVMRRLADAKQSWQELQQYPSLAELKEAVRLDGHLSVPNNGLRSACWKAFLLFDNVDTASWPRTLLSSRSAYNSLRLHFLRHIENPDEQPDPLNEDIDVRPSPTLSSCLRDGRGLTDS